MKDPHLPLVTLKHQYHRQGHQILIQFTYNTALINRVKAIPGTRWSAGLKSWYISNTAKHLELIRQSLSGHATLNDLQLGQLKTEKKHKKRKRNLTAYHRSVLLGYMRYLQGKRYSTSTVKTYLSLTADLIEFYNDHDLSQLNNRHVELFIEQVILLKNYAISTHRQFISSLKHFKAYYPDCKIEELKLDMPKKDSRLPSVLSKEEVIDIIRCTLNLKHRCIVALLYSSGLRIGELINLKCCDIDIDRRQVVVKQSKGRKDRYVILAESILPMLNNYVNSYRPGLYLFEGQTGERYSAESIRAFLKRSCKKAKITKYVSPHTLRHSYATHLLENGIDIRFIQELLGHAKPETTMIYTHVSKKDLLSIKSPLDIAVKTLDAAHPKPSLLMSKNL